VVFLLFGTILAYLAYRQIWYEAKRAVRVTGPLDPANQAKTRRAKAKQGVAG
jgi:ubiquinol-cytochrome c reductase cytochrome c1 subunit